MSASATAGPIVDDDAAVFSLPARRYAGVTLLHELRRPREVAFERRGSRWELRLPRPQVDRLEYVLEVRHRGGESETVPDPTNPRRVPGPFGDKSVVDFPGYEPPEWVGDDESPQGSLDELPVESRLLRTTVDALLWSAVDSDPEEPLPLLLVHDGPEMARFADVLRLFDHLVAFGEVPPFRAALLPPPLDRNETYSASARYAAALVREWLPALRERAPYERPPLGVGASLGAPALLHAHWTHPGALGGLLLQSGSFFRRRLDAHEGGFGRFARLTRFVSTVVGGRAPVERIPLTFTCGLEEENLDNNRFVVAALRRQGWDAPLVEHRDAHNWISWRDVLHPHLAELMLRAA